MHVAYTMHVRGRRGAAIVEAADRRRPPALRDLGGPLDGRLIHSGKGSRSAACGADELPEAGDDQRREGELDDVADEEGGQAPGEGLVDNRGVLRRVEEAVRDEVAEPEKARDVDQHVACD